MFNIFKKKIKNNNKRRSATQAQKISIWYSQDWKCNKCWKNLDLRTVKYDHIHRYSLWWLTTLDNLQALCADCHSIKTFEENLELINK